MRAGAAVTRDVPHAAVAWTAVWVEQRCWLEGGGFMTMNAHEASGAITFGAARSPERLVLHGSVVMAVAGTIAPGKLLEVRHCITHGNRVRSH